MKIHRPLDVEDTLEQIAHKCSSLASSHQVREVAGHLFNAKENIEKAISEIKKAEEFKED